MMSYESREGVDYIVDYYQLTGVEPTSPDDEINKSINNRLKEYHPDRLQGLAAEFQTA